MGGLLGAKVISTSQKLAHLCKAPTGFQSSDPFGPEGWPLTLSQSLSLCKGICTHALCPPGQFLLRECRYVCACNSSFAWTAKANVFFCVVQRVLDFMVLHNGCFFSHASPENIHSVQIELSTLEVTK